NEMPPGELPAEATPAAAQDASGLPADYDPLAKTVVMPPLDVESPPSSARPLAPVFGVPRPAVSPRPAAISSPPGSPIAGRAANAGAPGWPPAAPRRRMGAFPPPSSHALPMGSSPLPGAATRPSAPGVAIGVGLSPLPSAVTRPSAPGFSVGVGTPPLPG